MQVPALVVSLADQDTLELAGLTVRVLHAPGHTEGSVMFALPTVPDGVADSGLGSTVLSGDVLFAGSIGRTDLPGGSGEAMTRRSKMETLYRRVPELWRNYIFSEPDRIVTTLQPPLHGDSSGVRGAAWLWPA